MENYINIMDLIYPTGATYQSINSEDSPALLFGGVGENIGSIRTSDNILIYTGKRNA